MGLGGFILGGIIGSMIGGLPGAIVGAGLGGALIGNGKRGSDGGAQAEKTAGSAALLTSLFFSLGKLAKIDGVVVQKEADFVKSILRELDLGPEDRAVLCNAFAEGKKSEKSSRIVLQDVAEACSSGEYSGLMELYCVLALADGQIVEEERDFLRTAEEVFGLPGYSRNFFRQHSANGFRSGPPPSTETATSLKEDYQTLGVSPSASDEEVKKAWRKKALVFHPDKVQGKGLPEEFVQYATEQTRKINGAYDRICSARKNR